MSTKKKKKRKNHQNQLGPAGLRLIKKDDPHVMYECSEVVQDKSSHLLYLTSKQYV